jgi:signal recognition particle subunit SRP54
MTPVERRKPNLLNARRKQRVAKGSGTEVRDVNDLLKHFDQMKDMGKKLKKMQKVLRKFGKFA